MNVALLHRLPAAHQATPKVRIISGQATAKSKWEPRERAGYAARWKLGEVQVDPTLRLAATVFDVSIPLIVEAIDDLKAAAPTTPTINSIWATLSGAERDAFVRRRLLEVWDAVDRTTA